MGKKSGQFYYLIVSQFVLFNSGLKSTTQAKKEKKLCKKKIVIGVPNRLKSTINKNLHSAGRPLQN